MGFVVEVRQQVFGKAKTVCVWYRREDVSRLWPDDPTAKESYYTPACTSREFYFAPLRHIGELRGRCHHCGRPIWLVDREDGSLITLNAELKREIG